MSIKISEALEGEKMLNAGWNEAESQPQPRDLGMHLYNFRQFRLNLYTGSPQIHLNRKNDSKIELHP